ncbi:hypothetical protein AMTRI_Chr04g249970 [Amborella trichopoda]
MWGEFLHVPSRDPTVGFSASGATTDPTVDRTPTPSHGPVNFHVARPYCPGSRTCTTLDAVRRMARARGMCTAGEVGGVASGGRFAAWVEKVLESSMGGGVRWSMERVVHAVVYRNGVGAMGKEERESIVG